MGRRNGLGPKRLKASALCWTVSIGKINWNCDLIYFAGEYDVCIPIFFPISIMNNQDKQRDAYAEVELLNDMTDNAYFLYETMSEDFEWISCTLIKTTPERTVIATHDNWGDMIKAARRVQSKIIRAEFSARQDNFERTGRFA